MYFLYISIFVFSAHFLPLFCLFVSFLFSMNRKIELSHQQQQQQQHSMHTHSDELQLFWTYYFNLAEISGVECWLHLPCSKFRTNLNTIISILVGMKKKNTRIKCTRRECLSARCIRFWCIGFQFSVCVFCFLNLIHWIRYSQPRVFIILIKEMEMCRWARLNWYTWSNYNGSELTCARFKSISVVAVTRLQKKKDRSNQHIPNNTFDVFLFVQLLFCCYSDGKTINGVKVH